MPHQAVHSSLYSVWVAPSNSHLRLKVLPDLQVGIAIVQTSGPETTLRALVDKITEAATVLSMPAHHSVALAARVWNGAVEKP